MANDLNLCQFIGHLGKDPEVRYLPAGDAVANFSIACNWKTKDKEGVEWVRFSAFGKLAEICAEYLHKGSRVYVAGRMTTRKWQDKEGNDRYTTEIMANDMKMLDGKPREDGDAGGGEGAATPRQKRDTPKATPSKGGGASFDDMDDDIPF